MVGCCTSVSVSPIVPGLNDAEIPEILRRAADAGATHAFYVLLRLPGPVREVFEERLRAALPLRADRVLARVREVSGGKMYDARFGVRGRGAGPYAEMIAQVFGAAASRHGLGHGPTLDGAFAEAEAAQETTFRRPRGQLTLNTRLRKQFGSLALRALNVFSQACVEDETPAINGRFATENAKAVIVDFEKRSCLVGRQRQAQSRHGRPTEGGKQMSGKRQLETSLDAND